MDIATADVAFGVVGSHVGISLVGSCEVEARELAARHRHGYMGCGLAAITMGAHAELFDPHIAADVDVDSFTGYCLALC